MPRGKNSFTLTWSSFKLNRFFFSHEQFFFPWGNNWILNRFLSHPLRAVPSPPSVAEFLLSSFLRRSLSSALLSPPLSSLPSLSSPCRTQQWLHPPREVRPPSTKSSEARTPSAPPAGTHGAVVRRRRLGGGGSEGGAVGARGDADERGDDERGLPGAVAEEEAGAAKEEAEEEEVRKKVLLRIYGDGTDLFFDRADEVCTFDCISLHGQGPRLLARFPNGRIEEFIHARVCIRLLDSSYYFNQSFPNRKSARKLRKLQALAVGRRRGAILLPVAGDLGVVGEGAHEPTRRVLVRVHEPAHDPYQYPTHHGRPSDALLDPCANPQSKTQLETVTLTLMWMQRGEGPER
uniref:Uncharacterized protein n=1 Tax=Ananas comosus var. bracteatus TaxID=296719 RepID=A0A6V7NJX1_ANACO|nr:unnamed protein product [Ananas comosus var. bracteatus]